MKKYQIMLLTLALAAVQGCTTYNIVLPEEETGKTAALAVEVDKLAAAPERSGHLTPQQAESIEKTAQLTIGKPVQEVADQGLLKRNALALNATEPQPANPGAVPHIGQAAPNEAVKVESKRFGERYWAEFLALAVLKCIPGCF